MSDHYGIPATASSEPQNPSLEAIRSRPSRLWWLALLAVFFALNNVALLPAATHIDPPGPGASFQMLIGMGVGDIFAQVLVLSFFAVLGPGANLPRQGVVWLIATILIGSFAAGVVITTARQSRFPAPDNFTFVYLPLFVVPAVFCACQTPLWGLRYFLRWRTAANVSEAQDFGQISIRGMLVATAVVAVALGLCRLGLSLENMQWGEGRYGQALPASVWWSGVGIAAAIALAASAVVLPVTAMLVLRPSSGTLGVIFAVAYLTSCAMAIVLIISSIVGSLPRHDGWTILLVLYISITGYLLTPLAIFRSAGYRLWWGRPAG